MPWAINYYLLINSDTQQYKDVQDTGLFESGISRSHHGKC